jgi:hypothetical protein
MSTQEPNHTPEAAEPASEANAGRNFPLAIYSPWRQYRRFAALAATIALAAALGGLAGSLSMLALAAPKPAADAEPALQLQATLAKVSKDLAALKTSVESSNRSAAGQIARINDRIERSEKAQAEPAARLAALSESVARIEKRLAAAIAEAGRDVTGSVPERTAAKDQSKPAIVEGWVLREIYRGRALVESRRGLYEVEPGAELPGVGRVETITRQNGRWVVVTPKGLIVSMR